MISCCLPFHHFRSNPGRFHCQHEHCLYIFSWVYVWSLIEYTLYGSICPCIRCFSSAMVKIRQRNRVKPNIIHAVWAGYFYILNSTQIILRYIQSIVRKFYNEHSTMENECFIVGHSWIEFSVLACSCPFDWRAGVIQYAVLVNGKRELLNMLSLWMESGSYSICCPCEWREGVTQYIMSLWMESESYSILRTCERRAGVTQYAIWGITTAEIRRFSLSLSPVPMTNPRPSYYENGLAESKNVSHSVFMSSI